MDYKKIIKSQKLRLKILQLLSFLPDKVMVKLHYRISTGKKLNLNNPNTFNEKIQWYKLYYRHPLMVKCADKYAVREYVAEKGLSEILNECYGIYNSIEEINLNSLPKKFVLKVTNGCGANIFCENKNLLDETSMRMKLKEWIKPIKNSPGREWSYNNIKPRIVCEKYLEVNREEDEDLLDYKFFCFYGKPTHIQVDMDRFTKHKRNIYDVNWKYIDATITYPNVGDIIKKPKNLDTMLEVASILSEDFPHVRLDLYDYREKIIFGEMTFYHGSGYEKFSSYELEKEMGKEFILPEKLLNSVKREY